MLTLSKPGSRRRKAETNIAGAVIAAVISFVLLMIALVVVDDIGNTLESSSGNLNPAQRSQISVTVKSISFSLNLGAVLIPDLIPALIAVMIFAVLVLTGCRE